MTGPSDEPPVVDVSAYLAAEGVAAWVALAELASVSPVDRWTVAGGQMVTIHAARQGVPRHRVTSDADLVVDVRAHGRRAMREVADALVGLGFDMFLSLEHVSRFVRGRATMDLLAPEGMNGVVLTAPPGRAVGAPGATQALSRSELVQVRWSDGDALVRCPTLLGAAVAKAAAATEIPSASADGRLKHQQDLVLLLELLGMTRIPGGDELTAKDRRRIRTATGPLVADSHHPAWQVAARPDDVASVISRLLI